MQRDAGGSKVNTAMGAGVTAGLFVFGWVILGFMLLLNEIFGGAEFDLAAKRGRSDEAPKEAA